MKHRLTVTEIKYARQVVADRNDRISEKPTGTKSEYEKAMANQGLPPPGQQGMSEYPSLDDFPDPVWIKCQGQPICPLTGEEAMEAAKNGCVWCRRTIIHSDGSETIKEPSRQ